MNSTSKKTQYLYSQLFRFTTENDFRNYQLTVTPQAFGENSDFIKGKRILDLGCGGLGYAISSFLRYGASEVIGVDISRENIQKVQKRFSNDHRVVLYQMDINHLPPKFKNFDLVFSNGVIHHTISPERVLGQVHRVLKPGGYFIISLYGKGGVIPSAISILRSFSQIIPLAIFLRLMSNFWKRGAFILGDYLYVPVLHRYNEREATSLLRAAGFVSITRLSPVTIAAGFTKYLSQSQMNYKSFVSRILHGAGWIILKAQKSKII